MPILWSNFPSTTGLPPKTFANSWLLVSWKRDRNCSWWIYSGKLSKKRLRGIFDKTVLLPYNSKVQFANSLINFSAKVLVACENIAKNTRADAILSSYYFANLGMAIQGVGRLKTKQLCQAFFSLFLVIPKKQTKKKKAWDSGYQLSNKCIPDQIGIWSCWFINSGKPVYLEKTSQQGREPTTNTPYMVSMPDFNHIGGGQVLSQLPHPVVVVKQSFVALLQRFFRVLRTPKSILSS